jgi:hypothetical protein
MPMKRTDSTEGGREMDGGVGEGAAAKKDAARKSSAAGKTGGTAKKGAGVRSVSGGEAGEAQGGAKQPRGSRAASPATGRARQAASQARQPDLRADARNFAAARPEGWNHDEWLGFLEGLRERGHNIEDKEAIGSMLERERLSVALERVPGIGAQRVRAIAESYPNVYLLKDASPQDLADRAKIPLPLAERIKETLR